MERISTNKRLAEIVAGQIGLVYNDFSKAGATGKDYNILHASGCRHLTRANVNVPKYFFYSLEEAITWLNSS